MNRLLLCVLATGLLVLPIVVVFEGYAGVASGIEVLSERISADETRMSARTIDPDHLDALKRSLELQKKEVARLERITRANGEMLGR